MQETSSGRNKTLEIVPSEVSVELGNIALNTTDMNEQENGQGQNTETWEGVGWPE